MTPSAVSLEVGDIVVYGADGFARVEGSAEKEILGRTVTVLDLYVFDSSMRVSVPLERAQERGLRAVADNDAGEGALADLAGGRGQSLAWNRDGRLLKDRFAEGHLEAMIDVIGSLVDAEARKRLNDGQRTLLDRARKALARELAAALDVEQDEAYARIDEASEARRALVVSAEE